MRELLKMVTGSNFLNTFKIRNDSKQLDLLYKRNKTCTYRKIIRNPAFLWAASYCSDLICALLFGTNFKWFVKLLCLDSTLGRS